MHSTSPQNPKKIEFYRTLQKTAEVKAGIVMSATVNSVIMVRAVVVVVAIWGRLLLGTRKADWST
jgi:hypothetical protein